MQRCIGILGWIFGHNLVAARTTIEKSSNTDVKLSEHYAILFPDDVRRLSVLTENQYHGHVCTRCGYTVNKGVDSV